MPQLIRVLEHSTLPIGYRQNGAEFTAAHCDLLRRYYETGAGRRYYDLRHQAVRFRHYVGVLQAGDLTIEVLPKADAVPGAMPAEGEDFDRWRRLLLRMLAEAGLLPVDSFNTALLHEREDNLLELYLGLFLTEVEALLHRGLVKRYRQREGQVKALKGSLLFGPHLARNVVHQERFYTRHQSYDRDHLPHHLLRQALARLPALTAAPGLRGRAARALLAWPDAEPVQPTAATFARLRYDRKTAPYRPALRIARLLLLRLSPEVSSGPQELIALFFNMNHIWETYLRRTLQRLVPAGWEVHKPAKVVFWQAKSGPPSRMQPDILLRHPQHGTLILDAKWKRPTGRHAENDLRQLFAYAQHFEATHVRLLYPQAKQEAAGEGAFTRPLVAAGGAGPQVIRGGVSYIRVGHGPVATTDAPDAAGYLPCSLAAELAGWGVVE
jgi:5-methylcytosine-specific restriction enzyme subunit McrC